MRFEKVNLRLPGSPKAASVARDVVRSFEDEIPSSRFCDLELLVSEVVGNSIRHSGATERDEISLCVFTGSQQVRIEVTDPGDGFTPNVGTPSLDETYGRGLFLVDQLSDSWGVEAGTKDGTVVWFVLSV
jgi:anti-sigma regulatory factor (Ser/Thr protein kinase)